MPSMSANPAWRKLRSAATLRSLGADEEFIAAWRAVDDDGPLRDEVRARFEGVATKYSHVIVDEAQDLSLFQLRAVQRRADGLTLVGDDAQRSAPGSIGLYEAARMLDAPLEQMATAYRMSAEIADWLNDHARRHGLDAVELLGVRPTGVEVTDASGDVDVVAAGLRERWEHVAVIGHHDVWDHKGVEYDAVVVDQRGMSPSEVYLAASRAAHQLVVTGA
jgi:DNA helicase IV